MTEGWGGTMPYRDTPRDWPPEPERSTEEVFAEQRLAIAREEQRRLDEAVRSKRRAADLNERAAEIERDNERRKKRKPKDDPNA